ncbi:MAG: hypothetical protein AAF682_05980 [Planctomycetota bacterium]
MTAKDRHPTRDELLAMAYVDGELEDDARREIEERLGSEPDLRREVAQHNQLAVLARQMAPPEPADYEWDRLEAEWVHRGGTSAGLVLVSVGAAGLALSALWWIWISSLHPAPKAFAGALVAGALLLFLVTLRARLRTLPYDPYTKVKR